MEASKISGFAQDMRAGRWSRSKTLKRKAELDWHLACELRGFKED